MGIGIRAAVIAAMAVAVLALAGCSTPGPEALENRSFASTSVTEAGVPKNLYPGTTLQLSIINGEISGTGGCNSLFGTADLTGGTVKVTGELGSSVMACLPEIMAQDDWLRDFLKSGPTWSIDGDTLTLQSQDRVIVMQDTAAE